MSKSGTEETKNQMNEALKALTEIRKRPILLLDLEEVEPLATIKTQVALKGKNFTELDVVLHTPGGHIESAFNITKLLRKHSKKVNIIVPYMAKSAGTLICLGADKIILNAISELGPLDTQIRETRDGDGETYKSALNGFKALEQVRIHALENLDIATKLIFSKSGLKINEAIKLAIEFSGKTSSCLYNQLNPIMIGEYARALEVGQRYGIIILSRYMGWSQEKAFNVINKLVYDYPSHGFSIDIEELKELGLTAEEVPDSEQELVDTIRLELIKKSFGKGGSNVKLIEPVTPKEKPNTNETKRAKNK